MYNIGYFAIEAGFFAPLLFWPSIFLENFSDWRFLTKEYPLRSAFKGKWLNWQETGDGIGRFLTLSLGLDAEYLYLKFSPKVLFPFTKAVQIPFPKINHVGLKNQYLRTYCVFDIEGVPNVKIRRNAVLDNYLRTHLPDSVPYFEN